MDVGVALLEFPLRNYVCFTLISLCATTLCFLRSEPATRSEYARFNVLQGAGEPKVTTDPPPAGGRVFRCPAQFASLPRVRGAFQVQVGCPRWLPNATDRKWRQAVAALPPALVFGEQQITSVDALRTARNFAPGVFADAAAEPVDPTPVLIGRRAPQSGTPPRLTAVREDARMSIEMDSVAAVGRDTESAKALRSAMAGPRASPQASVSSLAARRILVHSQTPEELAAAVQRCHDPRLPVIRPVLASVTTNATRLLMAAYSGRDIVSSALMGGSWEPWLQQTMLDAVRITSARRVAELLDYAVRRAVWVGLIRPAAAVAIGDWRTAPPTSFTGAAMAALSAAGVTIPAAVRRIVAQAEPAGDTDGADPAGPPLAGGRFFDTIHFEIGGNIGTIAVPLAAAGVPVVIFEPMPHNLQLQSMSRCLNGLRPSFFSGPPIDLDAPADQLREAAGPFDTRVHTYHVALGDNATRGQTCRLVSSVRNKGNMALACSRRKQTKLIVQRGSTVVETFDDIVLSGAAAARKLSGTGPLPADATLRRWAVRSLDAAIGAAEPAATNHRPSREPQLRPGFFAVDAVLKIDVEGFEARVFAGMHRVLSDPARRPRVIAMEYTAMRDPSGLGTLFRAGYVAFARTGWIVRSVADFITLNTIMTGGGSRFFTPGQADMLLVQSAELPEFRSVVLAFVGAQVATPGDKLPRFTPEWRGDASSSRP